MFLNNRTNGNRGLKKIAAGIFCILFLLAVSCKAPNAPSNEVNVPSNDGKTYIAFNNRSEFDVNVYVNTPPASGTIPFSSTPVPKNGNRQFEISPSDPGTNGDTFYFEYLIPLGTVTIPHYDPANVRIKQIVSQEINPLDIPTLSSSTTTSSFLVVENDSTVDIWVQEGIATRIPYGRQDREIRVGENGVFVLPQNMTSISNYTVGSINRRNIPATVIQPGRIYSFKYSDSSLSLYDERHFNLDDRKKIWSITTGTSLGQYLQMGKQKPRRNPENGVVILGTLQYSLDSSENSRAYFALLDQYGEVTTERIFTMPDNPTIYFAEIHERENGEFLITYRAVYNSGTDDEEITTYLMCYTANGIIRWRVNFNDILPPDLDPAYCELVLEYIAEKNNKTFAIGGAIWDHWDYVASFVVEVTENALGTGASFSWPGPYISDFVLYDEGDGIILTDRSCKGLQYSTTLNAYIVVEYNIVNKSNDGSYKILSSANGSLIGGNNPNQHERFGFLGISHVGDKYYIFGEYLDVNEKFSAAVLRFNDDMTVDAGFPVLYVPSDHGNADFRSSASDDKKVVFAGSISTQNKFTVPYTYAIDRNTGAKLWENVYNNLDMDYNIVWNVEINVTIQFKKNNTKL